MLTKVNILLTGLPGCGKSTLINRIIDQARGEGVKVGGISTPEFRLSAGRRGGFLIRDVALGKEQIMAAIDIASSVRVGRYGVSLPAIRSIGVSAINQAVNSSDLIIIDEIGKMELAVREFQESVSAALNSPKPVLGTIGMKLRTPFVTKIKNRTDITVFMLTPEKRDSLYHQIISLLGL